MTRPSSKGREEDGPIIEGVYVVAGEDDVIDATLAVPRAEVEPEPEEAEEFVPYGPVLTVPGEDRRQRSRLLHDPAAGKLVDLEA